MSNRSNTETHFSVFEIHYALDFGINDPSRKPDWREAKRFYGLKTQHREHGCEK